MRHCALIAKRGHQFDQVRSRLVIARSMSTGTPLPRVDESVPCDRYSSFNKRSEPEGEDPWSCVVSVTGGDRSGGQRPRSGDARKDSNHRGGNGAESASGQQGRSESRQESGNGGQQASGSRQQDSSRQTSEDMSWEFTINEAPIARLESLDELDQDHGS